MSPEPTKRFEGRHRRLLDAAERVFTRDGLKGTTMGGIAAEAGVAKATAYAYLTDKEAAFRTVAVRLAGQLQALVEAELCGPASPAERIPAALIAKERLAYRLAHASPHARDLLQAKDALAAEAFATADAQIAHQLSDALMALGVDEPVHASRLLIAGSIGLAQSARSQEMLERDIHRFATALLAGLQRET